MPTDSFLRGKTLISYRISLPQKLYSLKLKLLSTGNLRHNFQISFASIVYSIMPGSHIVLNLNYGLFFMQNYHITLENVECIAWTTYTIFICTFLHFCSLTAPFLFHFHYMQKSSVNILSNITFCYPQKSYRFGQAFLGELSLSFQVLFQSMNVQSIMTAEV